MKKALIILIVIFLFSCQKNTTINPPNNVTFDESSFLLSWDEVPSASSYKIYINDQMIETTNTYYDLSVFENGIYDVKIRTIIGDKQSRYSAPISISINQISSIVISFTEEYISWSPIPLSTGYIVTLYDESNNLITTDNLTETTYDISNLIGIYKVKIVAYKNDINLLEKEFMFDTSAFLFPTNDSSFIFTFDKIIIDILIDGTIVPRNLYTIQLNSVIINGNYLKNLEHTKHVIMIQSVIPYYFTLMIEDIDIPYLISEPVATFIDSDLEFIFEMYAGSFSGITSNYELLSNEYTFSNNKLTISNSYFYRIKAENPELSQIVFTYLLTSGSYSQYGYISVLLTN